MLQRRFSPITLLLLSVNGIVGSAWLFAPLYAAKIAGSSAIIAWLLGGFATIVIALTFAELSTLLPIAGGTTRFAQLTQGVATGFVISWVSWLSCVTMPPIEVQAVLQYSATYFPVLIHLVQQKPVLTHLGLFFATLLMFGLCILNIASFKGFVRFNFIIFGFKFLVIVLTILMLIKTQFHPSNFSGAFHANTVADWEAILSAVATGGIAFAFTGFKHGVELAGETKNPQLAIPLSIVGSVIICLILYLGLQIAFIGAVDHASLKNGWENLNYSGEIGPFVGIATLLGLFWLAKLLLIDSVVSPLGTGLIYVTSTSRIIYAMSKNSYLPSILSKVNKDCFPVNAVCFNFAVGLFLFLPLPGWQNMVSFLVSAVVISYAMGPIALVSLRKQLPNINRPFRLPCSTLLSFFAFYFCNLMSYWTGWDTICKLMIAIAIGLIVFMIAYYRKRHTFENGFHFKALFWLVPYLTGLCVISYFGSYGGGKNDLTFGWDFLVIGLFSLLIFNLAVYLRLGDETVKQQFSLYQDESHEGLIGDAG
ncbi:MAG: APC family permease [Gammaproteobacteria bacterium]|nr:APC family permease [Gammaproteobacteria bacterium]